MISERLDKILNKLEDIKLFKDKIFGLKGHGLKMNKTIKLSELEAFESRYTIQLPEGYRDFLLNIGNGGAGPGYGLISLEKGINFYRESLNLDILSTPFEYTDRYLPNEDPALIKLEEDCDAGIISEEEFDQIYEKINAGTTAVSHEGCGYVHRLIITGPSRGSIWMDAECSDQGFTNLKVDFLTWYERWLDHILNGSNGCWWFDSRGP